MTPLAMAGSPAGPGILSPQLIRPVRGSRDLRSPALSPTMIDCTVKLAGEPGTGTSYRPRPLTGAGSRADHIRRPVTAFNSTAVGSPTPTTTRASLPEP